ncbi:MAG: phospholipid scramblase-related protein [Leptospirillia bacterium]
MEQLVSASSVAISQSRNMSEVLTGLEATNHYTVNTPGGDRLFDADEYDGPTLMRWFLKAARPFTINLRGADQRIALRLTRPFRFYFHEVEVANGSGVVMGKVARRFALLHRVYTVHDHMGRTVYELFGPMWKPWTFEIRRNGTQVGEIRKEWSGVLKEVFSDADNFGMSFPAGANETQKSLLLGAVFLIDFLHFENSGNNNN